MPLIANSQPIDLVLQNTIGRPQVHIFDAAGEFINPTNVTLVVQNTSGIEIASDDFSVGGTRIENPATGVFQFPIGDVVPNIETNTPGDLIFLWTVISGTFSTVATQVVKVVSACTMGLVPYFKLLIDKSAKFVDENPQTPCFLGYTDSQLIMFLEQGLSVINAYEPYPTFSSLDSFPTLFRHILLESSLVVGVMSQQLFAIDEDIPNFSDQGNSFVIQHAPQLAAFLNQISQRLDKLIPQMKLKLVNSGSLHVQAGSNFRMATLLNSSPNGVLFRNVYFRG